MKDITKLDEGSSVEKKNLDIFTKLKTIENCKNMKSSFGEVCFRCGKCSRFKESKKRWILLEVFSSFGRF